MPLGLKAIEIAKQNGMWNVYDAIEAQVVPEDLIQALASNATAQQNFEAFSDSTKKQLLWYIESAKRPETRAKRIEQIVMEAERNRNPLNYAANKKEKNAQQGVG